jgi:hypothetical protein
MAYLTIPEFRLRSVMPEEDIDEIERKYPGFLSAKLEEYSSRIDTRLAKRYVVPLRSASTNAPPEIVFAWLTAFATHDAYLRRGFNPSSEQDGLIVKQWEWADKDITETSDAEQGRYELMLLSQSGALVSGVSKGGPLSYSEASPYAWQLRQLERAERRRRV